MKRSIGLLLLLTGCQFIPGTKAHDIHRAEEAVRYGLDDPASGNFRNERVVGPAGQGIVCGEVNAKNRLGAYVGFRPFAYWPATKRASVLPEEDGTTASDIAILDFPKDCYPRRS